jgi:hypothetical protein
MTIDDHKLDQRLAALSRQAEPDEGSWSAIESRLSPRQARWKLPAAAGLAVAASVLVVVLAMNPFHSAPDDFGSGLVSAEIEAMRHQVNWSDVPRHDSVNGGLTTAWEENQQAIAELEQALARNPDNLMLMDFLAQARLRQSELVNHATASAAGQQTWSL